MNVTYAAMLRQATRVTARCYAIADTALILARYAYAALRAVALMLLMRVDIDARYV